MSIVGMDLHVRNSFLEATDRRGRPLRRGRVENTLAGLAEFLGPLEQEQQPIRVVLENTANSRAMKLLLERYGREAGVDLKAQVLDARKLRVIAESVNKCDKVDAAILCELARSKLKLPAVYVPEDQVFWLREHLRARADLVLLRTALKLRAHALLHRRGLWEPQRGGLFTKAGRLWMSQLVELDEAGREILDRFLAQLDAIEESIKQSERTLRRLSVSERWRRPAAILQTMPGVGLIVSLTILAELGDVKRFKCRAAVSNYSGFTPIQRDSNDKRYSGGITRRGPAHLRHAMVEAAWVAVRSVPKYRAKYDRVAARRGGAIAVVGVARTMLEDAWTMSKKRQQFRFVSAAHGNTVARGRPIDRPPQRQMTPAAGDPSVAG
jgi:transposase